VAFAVFIATCAADLQVGVTPVAAAAFRPLPAAAQTESMRPSFSEWLAGVRREALARGLRQEIVDEALSDIPEPLPVIIERDRAQAETILPLETYVSRRLTAKVVKTGRELFARHRTLLDEVGNAYGVSPRIVASVWGIESNFGRFSGVRPTVAALATLAWDPRRSAFFRGELFHALEILDRGDIELARMRGSWAGAMGQVQFMPSSYLRYAEDYDGDGRRDIWSSPADVFASIANYLSGHGWDEGESWGREVRVAADSARRIANTIERRAGTCQATRDMTAMLPMTRWGELGVRLPSGAALPAKGPDAALVSGATRHFLVSGNYDALLDYNCAHSYAISVGLLADAIGSSARLPAAPKRPLRKRPVARGQRAR
jgi:membrane-bound lytic murein transglycosylase B